MLDKHGFGSKKATEDFIDRIINYNLDIIHLKQLPKNIIGIARTNNFKELAEIYTTANVFFNPILEEVLGLTNIEAQACGTPVITFNTGDLLKQ